MLDFNGSGDTGAMPLSHLLAAHIIIRVWPVVVHPRIGTLASYQALITSRTSGVDCTAPHGPVSHQCSPIRPHPTLTVCLLRISPMQLAPPCYLCKLVFLVLQPNQTSLSPTGELPIAPRIFLCPHLFGPLRPLTLKVGPSSIVV